MSRNESRQVARARRNGPSRVAVTLRPLCFSGTIRLNPIHSEQLPLKSGETPAGLSEVPVAVRARDPGLLCGPSSAAPQSLPAQHVLRVLRASACCGVLRRAAAWGPPRRGRLGGTSGALCCRYRAFKRRLCSQGLSPGYPLLRRPNRRLDEPASASVGHARPALCPHACPLSVCPLPTVRRLCPPPESARYCWAASTEAVAFIIPQASTRSPSLPCSFRPHLPLALPDTQTPRHPARPRPAHTSTPAPRPDPAKPMAGTTRPSPSILTHSHSRSVPCPILSHQPIPPPHSSVHPFNQLSILSSLRPLRLFITCVPVVFTDCHFCEAQRR